MKKAILTIALLTGLMAATTAQAIIVWGDDFHSDPVGSHNWVEMQFLPATDNAHTLLNAYTLEFDLAVQGVSISRLPTL